MLDFFQIKQHRIVFSILAILIGLVLLLFIAMGISALTNRGDNSEYSGNNVNQISFTGEGKVYTSPDIAFVDFSVVTQGTNIDKVQDDNTKKMNKVVEYLKSFGIEEKDIKTTNYNLYPQYTYENNQIPQIMGYQINQTLSVKIRKIDQAGEILKNVVNAGINQVNSFYFGVENDEEIKEQARQIAIETAKKKAEKMASQIGIRLGKIIGFSESSGGYPVPMYDSYKASGMGGSGTPNIQAGENEIIVNVTLNYEVK
jgi:uncharacterized protein